MRTGPAILKSLTGFIICGFFLAINITTSADIIYVSTCGNDSWSGTDPCCQAPDGPKATIQAALDAAADYDTVIIAAGTYTGTGNRDIDASGRSITIRSADPNNLDIVADTIIDCQGTQSNNHRAFLCATEQKTNFTLAGLTIINNYSNGGVCYSINEFDTGSTVAIDKCVFKYSTGSAVYLMSIYSHNGWEVSVSNCTFQNNVAAAGAAIYLWGGALIKNCLFSGNVSTADSDMAGGGAIFGWNTGAGFLPVIKNCTFTGNQAVRGGAMAFAKAACVYLWNCILWNDKATNVGNEAYFSSFLGPPVCTVEYCDVKGGESGIYISYINWVEGNIDADPCFDLPGYWMDDPCNPGQEIWMEGDYHLFPFSPCIDVADPSYIPDPCETDIDGQPRILYDRMDIGADEVFPIAGDTEPDEDVDLADLAVFAGHILSDCDAPLWCDNCDADRSGKVTIEDFAHFSAHFLKGAQ